MAHTDVKNFDSFPCQTLSGTRAAREAQQTVETAQQTVENLETISRQSHMTDNLEIISAVRDYLLDYLKSQMERQCSELTLED